MNSTTTEPTSAQNFAPSYTPGATHPTTSSDFHKFKQEKRMDYYRQKNAENETEPDPEILLKQQETEELLDRKRKLEETTEKKSEKRKKKKDAQKLKQKQTKLAEKIKKETNIDISQK